MFHPDLHEQDPEKRTTYELLTQAINQARDPQAFILNQGWASVSLDGEHGLKELSALYEHLQARILEIIETLDTLRASPEMEIFHEVEQDESVIERVTAAQREELETEITGLQTEAEQDAEEARELAVRCRFESFTACPKSQCSHAGEPPG